MYTITFDLIVRFEIIVFWRSCC